VRGGRVPSNPPVVPFSNGACEIEIRPVYEMADFGDALTPEVAELHDRVRGKTAGR
jgi:hypothetical protein